MPDTFQGSILPPIRTALAEQIGTKDATLPFTASREYWLYWHTLDDAFRTALESISAGTAAIQELQDSVSDLEDAVANLVRSGTHAGRLAVPAGTLPINALWIETDRSNVIYQIEPSDAPTWVYVAGTMYATLSPDQRPADLGARDAGFDFRSTDSDPLYGARQFLWSGATWVEVTPSVQIATGTAPDVPLAIMMQDIPGCSLTLMRAGRYLITGCFALQLSGAGDAGQFLYGHVSLNGSTVPAPQSAFVVGAIGTGGTHTMQWSYTAPTAAVIAKLQARKTGGTGSSVAYASACVISALWIGP